VQRALCKLLAANSNIHKFEMICTGNEATRRGGAGLYSESEPRLPVRMSAYFEIESSAAIKTPQTKSPVEWIEQEAAAKKVPSTRVNMLYEAKGVQKIAASTQSVYSRIWKDSKIFKKSPDGKSTKTFLRFLAAVFFQMWK
jgi:hypothetical protein